MFMLNKDSDPIIGSFHFQYLTDFWQIAHDFSIRLWIVIGPIIVRFSFSKMDMLNKDSGLNKCSDSSPAHQLVIQLLSDFDAEQIHMLNKCSMSKNVRFSCWTNIQMNKYSGEQMFRWTNVLLTCQTDIICPWRVNRAEQMFIFSRSAYQCGNSSHMHAISPWILVHIPIGVIRYRLSHQLVVLLIG